MTFMTFNSRKKVNAVPSLYSVQRFIKHGTVFVSATEHGSSAGYNHCQNFPDFVEINTPE